MTEFAKIFSTASMERQTFVVSHDQMLVETRRSWNGMEQRLRRRRKKLKYSSWGKLLVVIDRTSVEKKEFNGGELSVGKTSVQDKKLEMKKLIGLHQKYQNLSKPDESI